MTLLTLPPSWTTPGLLRSVLTWHPPPLFSFPFPNFGNGDYNPGLPHPFLLPSYDEIMRATLDDPNVGAAVYGIVPETEAVKTLDSEMNHPDSILTR